MPFEKLVSEMMKMNVLARLWHWMTDRAQHHTTFEQFLTQNETLTDSLMESAMGNEQGMNIGKIGVSQALESQYSIEGARGQIKAYRSQVIEFKKGLEGSSQEGADELITILDDVVELSSKSLYLLKLK